jgi:hypothetical protein
MKQLILLWRYASVFKSAKRPLWQTERLEELPLFIEFVPFYADIPINYFRLEEEIVICMVGAEAVKYYLRCHGHETRRVSYGDCFDMEEATVHYTAIRDLYSSEGRDNCFRRLREFAAVLIAYDPVWIVIENLAQALLKRKTVAASTSRSLYRAAFRLGHVTNLC